MFTIFFIWPLLPYWQLPDEAKELEKKLKKIMAEKSEAIRSQDFEKVIFFYKYKF